MRLIVGLDRPSGGDATIGGMQYADLRRPLRVVGALLDRRRVDEVLDLVGLHDVAHERAGTFSLGMGQRLGLAMHEPRCPISTEDLGAASLTS